ncbi:MAG: endo-1,4-beta-xylanase [Muribaculaceae bacterium]
MKRYNYLIGALALAPVMAGCADYFDTNNYTVEKPAETAQYEYLKAYQPLKTYVDRAAHPGFLLGTGVNAEEYLKGSAVFLLTNSNFDQVTTGNAMKYASVVADDGTMNFGTVRDFVGAATEAGLEVYGHTLCWHEQQNVKWLNSLIADKTVEIDPNEKIEVEDAVADFTQGAQCGWGQFGNSSGPIINSDGYFELTQDTPTANFWELQYQIIGSVGLKAGQQYTLKVMVKGSGEGKIRGKVGDWSGGAEFGNGISFGTDWEEKTLNFTAAVDGNNFVLFQHGDFVGTIQIQYVKIIHEEAPAVGYFESLISNGNLEGDEVANFYVTQPSTGGPNPAVLTPGAGADGSRGIVIESHDNPTNTWDTQFFLKSNVKLNEGDKIHVSFKYRADKSAGSESQAHGDPGSYIHWDGGLSLNFTPDWQTLDKTLTIDASMAGSDGMQTFAWNLNVLTEANKYYFDDIVFEIERTGNTIPLTPEEKAEILTAEMERWVKAMMEATEGKVKAWDVVNEPLSGGPRGQRYDLQHAATSDNPANKFYWQDYLGDNYVRVPIKFARQYFAENGGNPDDLKLFINDYNLESDWDDNQKLKSLLQWIEQWESDGVTKIDGIGSQMHVSYSLNPTTQKSKEEHIVKMYQLLASSGKLVRITELDMGITDENGNAIKTADLTFEQKMKMSDYFKFIVEKYFEIIPVSQQYGICAWAQTDSPEGSGWRAGEPIGLWDLNYSRKPAYGGFADGLSGK